MSRRHRHAPNDWQQGATRVRHIDGPEGTFVGNSQPMPGVTPRSWLGVLVRFDGEDTPLDVDPADLEVIGQDATAARDHGKGVLT